jgi:DNA-binding transcriptional regulator YhcF (GntR family)
LKAILEEGKSIYLQISQSIEDDILNNVIAEEEPVPSTNQLARHYSINPATAAKGVSLLTDDGIIYKKRGIGMYVKTGAREIVLNKRRLEFYSSFMASLDKAFELGVEKSELIRLIEEGDNNAK